MKQQLLDLLEEKGFFKEADALAAEGVTVEDFVKANPDIKKIPGVVDVLQPKASGAPHNMSEDEKAAYFFEDPESRKKYEAEESKLARDLSEKKRLVDEYQRSKDDSHFNWEIGPFQLANEYARKQHIKGNEGKAWANDIAAKLAFASDFAPVPFSVIGPVIRLNQTTWNEPDKVTDPDTWRDFGVDLGTSVLGQAKGAAKAGYEGVKHLAGPIVGRLFNTKLGKNIEKSLGAIDARAEAKDLFKARADEMYTINDFARKYEKGQLNELEVLAFADKVADDYPQLAKALRSKTNLDAGQRESERLANEWTNRATNTRKAAAETADKDYASMLHETAAKDSEEALKHEANALIAERKLPEAAEHANIELNEAKQIAKDKFMHQDILPTKEGNLYQPVYDIDKAYKRYKEATAASPTLGRVVQAASKPAVKAGLFKTYNDRTDYSKYEKENKAAIDWTIDKYKRQWDAGFAPRGNEGELIMKAYAQYLKEREGK